MTVAFVGTTRGNSGLNTSLGSVTVPFPAGAVAGHTAIATVVENSGSATYTAPAGWTVISGPDDNNANLRTQVWAKDLTSGDIATGSITITSNVTARLIGRVTVYSGTAAASITFAININTAASTTLTTTGLTTTIDNSMITKIWVLRAPTAAPAPTVTAVPSNQIIDGTVSTNFGTSPNYSIVDGHRTALATPPGAFGGSDGTASQASTSNIYTLALPPVSAGGGIHHFIVSGGAEVPMSLNVVSGGIEK